MTVSDWEAVLIAHANIQAELDARRETVDKLVTLLYERFHADGSFRLAELDAEQEEALSFGFLFGALERMISIVHAERLKNQIGALN